MQLKLLAETLEDVRKVNGQEYWHARDIFEPLGYSRWENFRPVIDKAMESCKNSDYEIKDHFLQGTKMIKLGKGGKRGVEDFKLTRYACYLIAQNGNSKIPEIAFAQTYFAMQTRKQEILEKNIEEIERLVQRKKLSETEREFSKIMFERDVDGKGIANIRNAGDNALFKSPTKAMKQKFGVNQKKPLADVLPSVTLKAKDLATEMTTVNTKKKDIKGEQPIMREHVSNSSGVRKALTDAGIYPENLPPEEDIKRVENRFNKTSIEQSKAESLTSVNKK